MYSFSVIGIRLLAAYFIFSGLASSGYVLTPIFQGSFPNTDDNFYWSLWVLTSLVFGILIFLSAKPFSKLITMELSEPKLKTPNLDVIAIGTFLIGLFFLGDSLPYAINQSFFLTNQDMLLSDSYNTEVFFSFWTPVIFSLLLMAVAFPYSKLVSKLRKM